MNKRNVIGNKVQDSAAIQAMQFNEQAGAQKQVEVGPKLLPLDAGTGAPTTNATTAKALPSMGRSIAVYNNGTIGSITFGDATVTSLAIGATNATTKAVGIPCPPNAWTYLSAGEATHVIASAATMFVFLIADDTSIVKQTTR